MNEIEDSDFLAYFMNNYSSEFHCEISQVPTYLSYITPFKKDILLVYNNKDSLASIPTSPMICKKEHDDSSTGKDLTGSPLTLESDETILEVISTDTLQKLWTIVEESHFPIPIDKSREFLNAYNMLPKTLNVDGLFVICDQNDHSNAAFVGTSSYEGFLGSHIITFEGYHRRIDKCLAIPSLLKKHDTLAKEVDDAKVTVETSCWFEIYGHPILEDQVTNLLTNGSVRIEVNWDQPTYEVSDNSTATAVIQCIVGHSQSEAVLLTSYLDLLQKYIDIAEEFEGETSVQKLTKIEFHSNDDVEIDFVDVISNVFIKFDEIQQLRQMAQMKIQQNNNLRSSVSHVCLGRPSLDFTDELWNILTKCQNYIELYDCFNYIFEEIVHSAVKPYVSEDNNTRIATIIRDVGKGSAIIKTLTGCEPIEMLIEIGIEKLRKDYVHIFATCGLSIVEYLKFDKIVAESETNDTKVRRKSVVNDKRKSLMYSRKSVFGSAINESVSLNVMKQKCTKIAQVYTVTEILLLAEMHIQSCATSKTTTFGHLAKAALEVYTGQQSPIKSYSELQCEPLQTFRINIPFEDIKKENIQSMWKLILKTENEDSGVISTFVQSCNSLFPSAMYQISLKNNITQDSDLRYHCYEYKYYWNKFF